MDVIKTHEISSGAIEKVMVHPLVLLSVVDHYNKVAKDTRKRVVGVLLAKEHVVRWYNTGTILQENDLDIHGLFNDFLQCLWNKTFDFVAMYLNPGIPTQAYCAVEEVKE
ncbi:hypothetical protein UlMin_025086, partial [Ulmus minor]